MTEIDVYKCMLKSSPFTYFYGKFIRQDDEGADFKIYETNLKLDKLVNSTLSYIIENYNFRDIDINNIIKEIDKNGLYESEFLKINKLDGDKAIIWFKDYLDKKILEKFSDKKGKKVQSFDLVPISRDIGNKKLVNRFVKENDIRFKQISDNINDVIIIRERENVIYVNQAFEKIFGKPCSTMYKSNTIDKFLEHVYPQDRYKIRRHKYEDSFEETIRIVRGDNEIRWVWYKSNVINNDAGKELKKVIIISDITSKKDEEFQLEKLKIDFFSNLSHEFKTPINLIFTSLQMLKFSLDKKQIKEDTNYERYIKVANQNIFRLTKLVDNLIDCTRLSSGEIKYNPSNNDIVSFIEDICSSVVKIGKSDSIEIIFDTEIEEKIIAFDVEKMERVMFNLLSNAIKSIKLHGKIEVSLLLERGNVVIKVKDNGVGFSKDKTDEIFGIFNHINSRMTKISEGSGVGLFIVKSLVEMHGGNITVESELGRGAEFIVRLPDVVSNSKKEEGISKQIEDLAKQRAIVEFSDIYW